MDSPKPDSKELEEVLRQILDQGVSMSVICDLIQSFKSIEKLGGFGSVIIKISNNVIGHVKLEIVQQKNEPVFWETKDEK